LDTFPSVVSCSKFLFSDGYTIFCSASDTNVTFWSKKPPHCKQEMEHNPRHMTIRVGTTSLYLIGPCFLDELPNAASHSAVLETWLKTQLRDRGLIRWSNPYFALSVREVLNDHLPARWIGRGSPTSLASVTSPPRSPELSTSGSSLWGNIKGRVVPLRYTSNGDMHRAAEDVFRTITSQMLRYVPQTTWRGIRLCVQHQGAHTDPLDV
jgi:hypothetical protein